MPAKKAPKRKRIPRGASTKKVGHKHIQKVNVHVQSSGGGGGSGSAAPMPTAFRDTAGEARHYDNLLAVVKKTAENIKEDAARAMEGYRAQERLKRDEEMENRAMHELERPIFNAPIENTKPLAEAVAEAVPVKQKRFVSEETRRKQSEAQKARHAKTAEDLAKGQEAELARQRAEQSLSESENMRAKAESAAKTYFPAHMEAMSKKGKPDNSWITNTGSASESDIPWA